MNKSLAITALALATTLSACATPSRGPAYDRGYGYEAPRACYECGRIERIEKVYGVRENSRTGAVLGGIIGAVAARELPTHGSQGNKNTATVAGAVAGAVAGNAIENKVNEETFDIHVRMDDGRLVVINRNSLGNGVREGAYVRLDGTRIIPLR